MHDYVYIRAERPGYEPQEAVVTPAMFDRLVQAIDPPRTRAYYVVRKLVRALWWTVWWVAFGAVLFFCYAIGQGTL